MLTDPDGYVGGVIAAAALVLSKLGWDRVRSNSASNPGGDKRLNAIEKAWESQAETNVALFKKLDEMHGDFRELKGTVTEFMRTR